MQSGSSRRPGAPLETDQTAELDSSGLLKLQDRVMRQQDEELQDMEKTVTSTKVREGKLPGTCQVLGLNYCSAIRCLDTE